MALIGKTVNTIRVDPAGHNWKQVRGKATATLLPGQRGVMGAGDNVGPVAAAGAVGRRIIVVENDLEGKTVIDSYATDEEVQMVEVHAGQRVMLHIAASQTIVRGDKLAVNASGSYTKAAGTEDQQGFEADEDITTGAGDTGLLIAVAL